MRGPEVDQALRAAEARPRDAPLPLLEAYAVLSAAHGEAWKARQLLAETVRRRNARTLTPAEWLVLGLLSERHGLSEDAQAAITNARTGAPPDGMVAAFFRARGRPTGTLALGKQEAK